MPILLNLSLDIYFVDPKAFGDAKGLCGSAIKQAGFQVEGIGEGVRRVHAHHHCAVTQLRQARARCRRQTRFAHAAFAAEQKDPHGPVTYPFSSLAASP